MRPGEDLAGRHEPLLLLSCIGLPVAVVLPLLYLAHEDDDETDGQHPGGEEPGDGELLGDSRGVSVDGKGLEPLDGGAEDREEAGYNRHDEEAVDEVVLVARVVELWQDPVQQEPQGEEGRGHRVRVGEVAVGRRLVDELGHEHNGGDDACDEADGADNDVEVGEAHLGGLAEEDEEEG